MPTSKCGSSAVANLWAGPNTDTHNPNTSNTDAETARLRRDLRYQRLTGDCRAGTEEEEVRE
jgi:hypothetical protein